MSNGRVLASGVSLRAMGFEVNQKKPRMRYCTFCERASEYVTKKQGLRPHFIGKSTLDPRDIWLRGLPCCEI